MTAPAAAGETTGNKIDILVLAGSRAANDPVAAAAGVAYKCLAPVAGRTMLLRVVDALLAWPGTGRIGLVLDDPSTIDSLDELAPLIAAGRLVTIPARATPAESVRAAASEYLSPPLLITTGDHPLLKPEWLTRVVAEAEQGNYDVAAALARETTIRSRFPESRRTYLKFSDGPASGCNLFVVRTERGLEAIAFWRRVEQERKKPWRMARKVGLGLLFRYLLGRLSSGAAMAYLSARLELRAGLVFLDDAEAAVDVDKPDDLALVERIIAARDLARAGVA
ncbi:nucleotidyltransferase family protein [Oceanibacterium hippocampi]|uniref:2-phospho-L-lactate guanylyltransferase n=1 Tax=Oceanibacterium hippocampi TaxID=745714 RepID=A0A1Y5TYX6_9PROT|nr:nucleotidyltransferase family protein [Oceanibacterium hippocampi]SLN76213.1 2-phospho-L-lactate guanylyltransferase [Oceanibacterium hippocampi]